MKKSGIVAIIVVVLALGAVFLVLGSKNSDKSAGNNDMSNMDKPSNKSKSTDTDSAPTATNSVSIESFAYTPANITVKKGTTVTWTNKDSVGHTVTNDKSGSGPNSDTFKNGQTYSFTFNETGTFSYHCTPHPYMKGTVTVTE